jgi:ligand-binding SRPBCC domain-containing protein
MSNVERHQYTSSNMRTFALSSKLSAAPEQVWSNHVASEVSANGVASHWPQVVTETRRTILFSKYDHKRTVSKVNSGCEITDEVAFEPRFHILSPWLKASEIMKFRRLHDRLRETYGKA